MSSVSSATSGNAAYYASQKSMFSKLDTDSDGKLTKDELVAGRPKDVSASQAAKLYSSMDTKKAGSISEDQFDQSTGPDRPAGGIESLLSGDAMTVLMLMSQQGGMAFGDGMSQGGAPSAAELYADMDADSDGALTQAEFVAARPGEMSEEDATAFFATIDTEQAGSITEEQFEAGMPAPGGPPPGGGSSTEDSYDAMDTNKDGVVSQEEFLAGRPVDVSAEDAATLYGSIDTEDAGSITEEQFAAFIKSPAAQTTANVSGGIEELLALLDTMSSSNETATDPA